METLPLWELTVASVVSPGVLEHTMLLPWVMYASLWGEEAHSQLLGSCICTRASEIF